MNSEAFFRKLQEVTTKIHATANLDEIMLDLGLDFCELFDSDRLTLYAVTPEKDSIVSRVKTGLSSFRDLKLPLGSSSVAGFVAQARQTVNIADVYDELELRRLSPALQFQRGVDQRTGYRTRARAASTTPWCRKRCCPVPSWKAPRAPRATATARSRPC